MGDLSKIVTEIRRPITISVPSYLMDHRFEGATVMPAVEAMQVLAASVREAFPGTRIRIIKDANFEKFLYIEPGTKSFSAFTDLCRFENGDIVARLLTRSQSGRAAITRVKEHAVVRFSTHPDKKTPGSTGCRVESGTGGMTIAPERIYRELVPFGSSYHNITDAVELFKSGAIARVRAADIEGAGTLPNFLGSPFPLDAAFHIACVWGQRFYGIVAFPVGFACREIIHPTQPGNLYLATVTPLPEAGKGCLLFDLRIETLSGDLCEGVRSVCMRDVSAGRIKPPRWIVEDREATHESVFP